jgi:hypothetical protein
MMYLVFGRRWILWDMLQGVKMALFANEMEYKMLRDRYRKALDAERIAKDELEAEKKRDPLMDLPADTSYKIVKEKEKEHDARVTELKEKLQAKSAEVNGITGELGRLNNIIYHNRLKYDFLSGYDLSTHKGYEEIKKEMAEIGL